MRNQLKAALTRHEKLPMQIRTPDGRERLDIYRHSPFQKGTTTIIKHSDGSTIAQPHGKVWAILNALGIKDNDSGGLVISYGASDAVTANRPNIYPDPGKVMREREAEQTMTLTARLAKIDSEYASLVRKLDTAALMKPLGSEQVHAKEELASLKKTALRLESDWPQDIGKRGEMPAAARVLNTYQNWGWFFESLESASGERVANPPPGQSVTERRLATIRELINRTPELPDNMRGPFGEAKLLVVALMEYGDFARWSRPLIANGSLTEAQYSEIHKSPRKYFDFLLEHPTAWQQMVQRERLEYWPQWLQTP